MSPPRATQGILLTGQTGRVGRELVSRLRQIEDLTLLDHRQLDLGKPEDIRHAVREVQPNVIVNTAAYTAVDKS